MKTWLECQPSQIALRALIVVENPVPREFDDSPWNQGLLVPLGAFTAVTVLVVKISATHCSVGPTALALSGAVPHRQNKRRWRWKVRGRRTARHPLQCRVGRRPQEMGQQRSSAMTTRAHFEAETRPRNVTKPSRLTWIVECASTRRKRATPVESVILFSAPSGRAMVTTAPGSASRRSSSTTNIAISLSPVSNKLEQ